MFGVLKSGRLMLLGLAFCLPMAGSAMGQANSPLAGQYVGPDGQPIARPPTKVIGPNGQVITNPAVPASTVPSHATYQNLPAGLPTPPVGHHQSSAGIADDGGITLDFVDADVRDVAKAVLGDFLGLSYAVGASVTGTVTIQTSRPVPKADVLPVLEQSLQLNNLALVKRAGIYNIVPLADARRQSGAIATARRATSEPGFGVQIVPLKYVGAAQMQHLLEPLVPSQAIVYADASRNFLIIQGSQEERSAMVDEIGLFDVDWLSNMSFSLLTPKYTDVTALVQEMSQIVGGQDGALSGAVRLIPIQRLNAILAISSQPRYLAQLQQWMERLDRPGQGSDRRIFFYAVQNGRASDLAEGLNHSLYGENAKTSNDQNANHAEMDSMATNMQMGGGSLSAPQPQTQQQASASPSQDSGSPSGAGDRATVTVDKTNNALLIYGTPQQYSVIEDVLHHMDIAPVQIQLEAAIAEVTLNDGLQYGVQYFYQPSNKHTFILSDVATAAITPQLPGFSYLFTQGTNIKVILSALSNVTHVEVVSSPNIMVLNNGTASLTVGDQVPIATSQAVGVETANAPIVNTIEYHATGVILKVTPSVNRSGLVTLDVSQEVSNLAPNSEQSSTLGSPTFEERKVVSTVAIHDTETVALGGLISNSRTRGSDGIPLLSEIPYLGGLFGTKKDNTVRTELMVLITPHVVERSRSGACNNRRAASEISRRRASLEAEKLSRVGERGFALATVLWGIAALSLIAGVMIVSSLNAARIDRNAWLQLQVRSAADEGVQNGVPLAFRSRRARAAIARRQRTASRSERRYGDPVGAG